jgi:hypothetical protein
MNNNEGTSRSAAESPPVAPSPAAVPAPTSPPPPPPMQEFAKSVPPGDLGGRD